MVALVAIAPFVASADPPPRMGELCVGPHDAFVVENCGNRFYAAGMPGEHSPPCTNKPPRRQHFRVGNSAWFDAPTKGHRCVALPVGRTVWFHIKPGPSWKQAVPASCKSGVMDLNGPNAYAATFFLCTKRKHAHDDIVATLR